MAKVEAWYEQDLKRPVRINYLDGSFFNQDAAGSRIGVKVYSDGQAVTLAGSITGYCVQADGTTVPISGTRSGNTAYIDIPQSALSVPGPLTVTIKNTESSVITTLCAVVGIVTQSRTGVQVDPGQTVTDWTNQISAQLQACQDAADNVGAIVAVPYANLTFPVEVDTYTTYNGNLYCCTTRIAESESFTAAHWRQTNVCREISDLKSALSIVTFGSKSWESGGINNGNGTKTANGTRINSCLLNRSITKIFPNSGYKVGVCVWDNTGTWLGYWNGSTYITNDFYFFTEEVDISSISREYIVRVTASKTSDTTITTDVSTEIAFGFEEQAVFDELNDDTFYLNEMVTAHINLLDKVDPVLGYYYDGFVKTANNDWRIYPFIPIKKGTTYYYRSISGTFSRIYYYGQSPVTFSGDSGSFTASYDGFVAITGYRNYDSVLTTTEELRTGTNRHSIFYPKKLYVEKNFVANTLVDLSEENLVDGSVYWEGTWNNASSWITDTDKYRGLTVKKRTGTYSGLNKAVNVEAGKHYHFSAWYKVSSAAAVQLALTQTESTASVYMWDEKGYSEVQNTAIEARQNRSNKWRRINLEFECIQSGIIHPLIQAIDSTTLYVCGYSVEEGYNKERPVYNCLKDGTGDFDQLTEAIRFSCLFFDATVYVGSGDWDIIDEVGTWFMSHISSYRRGLYLKNRVRLVFSSDSKVLANYTGDSSDVMEWFSPFNAAKYGFTIENANIQCSKIRYAFHDERNSEDDEYTNYYLNCKMYIDNTNNTTTTAHQCIGGGLGLNGHIIIDGGDYQSVFPSHIPGTGYRPISYHNSAGSGKSRIDIRNVYIHDGGIRLNWYGSSEKITECYVSGCSFTHDVESGPETAESSIVNVSVTKWNNEIRPA